MDTYQSLNKLEVEVFLWRRGSTRVSFDLDNAFVRWRETSRWNRDFTRSLKPEQMDLLRRTCAEIHFLDWPYRLGGPSDEIRGSWYRAWTLTASFREPGSAGTGRSYFGGRDELPDGFELLSDVIRRICRQDFRVSE